MAVEGMSGGKNMVIFDDLGMPSIMVKVPKLKNSELITGGTADTHDAFICNSVEYDALYMGKYLASVVNGRAYSLPGKDPAASLSFDTARAYCRTKGTGWHLPTNAFYAAVALWSKKNGTQPHGNTNYGADYAATWEKGIVSMKKGSITNRTATGTGPDSWYHDYNAATGIADLCGDVWEWAGGMRLVDGEIQVIPYGNAMADIYSGAQDIQAADSTAWKALNANGEFVEPGSAGTLKWDYTTTPSENEENIEENIENFQLVAEALAHQQYSNNTYGYKKFGELTAKNGLTVPKRAIALGLSPEGTNTDYDSSGGLYMRNNGEQLSCRGGCWSGCVYAGAFALNLLCPRSYVYPSVGFRVAYYGDM